MGGVCTMDPSVGQLACCPSICPPFCLQWSMRKPFYSPSPPPSVIGRERSWGHVADDEHEDGGGALQQCGACIAPLLLCCCAQ